MPKDKKAAKSTPGEKKDKPPKLVRDSYTIPDSEYKNLEKLKARCLKLETNVKKSELLRAGLLALSNMDDDKLLQAINSVERLKTGRPKQ